MGWQGVRKSEGKGRKRRVGREENRKERKEGGREGTMQPVTGKEAKIKSKDHAREARAPQPEHASKS